MKTLSFIPTLILLFGLACCGDKKVDLPAAESTTPDEIKAVAMKAHGIDDVVVEDAIKAQPSPTPEVTPPIQTLPHLNSPPPVAADEVIPGPLPGNGSTYPAGPAELR